MKKLLFLLLGIILVGTVSAQRFPTGVTATSRINASGGGGYTTQYQAVLTEWGYTPGGDTATWQNNMVYSLDTAGIWDNADLIYVLAVRDSIAALEEWTNPSATANDLDQGAGTMTFTEYQGYEGNNSNYFLTDYNPSIHATNYALNSACFAAYIKGTLTGTRVAGGATDGTNEIVIYTNFGSASYGALNDEGYTTGSVGNVYVSNRQGSADVDIWVDGVKEEDGTYSSTSIPNDSLDIGAWNGGSNPLATSEIMSLYYIGGGLTDAQVGYLFDIWETYMDAIGQGELP